MVTCGGLNVDELEVKLISMGYNGSNVFQCVKVNVITHMKKKMLFHFYGNTLFSSLNQLGCVDFMKAKFGHSFKGLPASIL
jgi:hypothetical protein